MTETSVKNQYFAAIVVNMLAIGYGVACGWTSPNFMTLMSEETPLPSGIINIDEASWIAAFLCVGGFIGNIFFGFITNSFGRKEPLLAIAVPVVISWSLILYGKSVYWIYAARILNGFSGGGIFVIVPQYLSEIANDRVRGTLGSTLVLNCNLGILIAFVLGAYCDYYTTPKFVIALTTVFVVLFPFFPESPSYLYKTNDHSGAEKSIKFYQNMNGKEKTYELVQQEITKLKSTFGINPISKCNEKTALNLSDFKSKSARRAMAIGVVLVALNQFCGCFAMLNYTATIFKESGSNMSPNMSAIVVGVIQLAGSYVSTFLVDRSGRKFLLAISSTGTALGLISLGTYSMLNVNGYDVSAFNWIPISSFSFVIFIASWGVLTLPFLVISEIMPEKLKNFGSSFCMQLLWVFAFIMLKFLPLLTNTLGMHGSMFLFASCCLTGATFIVLVMPETKGKSRDEIMQLLG